MPCGAQTMIHIISKPVISKITFSTSLYKNRLFFALPVPRRFLFHNFLKFFSQYSGKGIIGPHVLRTGGPNRPQPVLLGGFL